MMSHRYNKLQAFVWHVNKLYKVKAHKLHQRYRSADDSMVYTRTYTFCVILVYLFLSLKASAAALNCFD